MLASGTLEVLPGLSLYKLVSCNQQCMLQRVIQRKRVLHDRLKVMVDSTILVVGRVN